MNEAQIEKEQAELIYNQLKNIGVELVDIVISPLGDYFENKTKELNKNVGAVINISL